MTTNRGKLVNMTNEELAVIFAMSSSTKATNIADIKALIVKIYFTTTAFYNG